MKAKKRGPGSHGITAEAEHRRVRTESVSGGATVGNGKDLERFAAWLRRQWEARFSVRLTDARDFEQDAIVAVLETQARYGLTLSAASALFVSAASRYAGNEHFRRSAVVHLTDHALSLVRAMRAGKLEEAEAKRRARMGQKKASRSATTGASVLARYDVFAAESESRVSIAA